MVSLMNRSRIPAGYWLLIGLAIVSVGLVGTMFIPPPAQCLNDGTLDVQVADTFWRVSSKDTGATALEYKNWKDGEFCEPVNGIIPSDSLTIIQENSTKGGLFVHVNAYRGGRKWTDKYEVFCSSTDLIDVLGVNQGRQCRAIKALTARTSVTVQYLSRYWPTQRQAEMFQTADEYLSDKRTG